MTVESEHIMKIGELAVAAGTQVETIRYYEREGLLPEPARTSGNYRDYGQPHVEKLSFIRQCRALDMSLDEVRALLNFMDSPADNCAEVNALLDEHIEHVGIRIRELKQLERDLRSLRELCIAPRDVEHCGILQGLSRQAKRSPAKSHVGHIHGSKGKATSPTR